MKKKNIFIFIISILIGFTLFFGFSLLGKKNIDNKINDEVLLHNGKKITDILIDNNYDKVGINPNKYKDFGSFLTEFKTYSGVLVDPLNEKIVIGLKKIDGDIIFIPFDYKKDKKIFDNKIYKNLAILDIYKAYKDGGIYGGVDSKYGHRIMFEKDYVHSKTDILNKIATVNIDDKSNNVNKIIDSLEKSKNLGISNTELLSYLYDFTGDYKKGIEKRDELCKKNKDFCKNKVKVELVGKILDNKGRGLEGVKITLLNNDKYTTISDNKGNYKLLFDSYNFSHLRFKASLKGYSDGYSSYSLNNTILKNINLNININLSQADNIININNTNKSDYIRGKYYVIKDRFSKYFIPREGLYYENGKKYDKLNIMIYTYLFTKTTSTESMLANDTFDPVYGYVGNIMKTFGMPYIQFIDKDSGQELFIKSSNPMILQNQIYHMKELYNNHDKIYEAVTDEDMKFLVKKTKELGGYPIDFDFLTKNNMLRWPVWWVLDRKTGTWGSVGSAVLNEGGLVELPFYSIKDN